MSAAADLGLLAAAAAVRERSLSPSELVAAALSRVEAVDGAVNALITVAHEAAIETACESERRLLAGEQARPLEGVPVVLKDNIETKGLRTTAGSAILADSVPDRDAAVVRRLREAGAIVLGKANMHEFACGVTTENPHFGVTRNPWNLECTAAGSSGGSAAAVAASEVSAALGTDTGGSVCLPAAACGVVGLRPTQGRIDVTGTVPLAWSLDTVGPIARSVEDCALLHAVIGGRAPDAPAARRGAVGVPRLDVEIVSGEVRAALEVAVRDLKAAGVSVGEIELDELEELAEVRTAWLVVMATEACAYHAAWIAERLADYGEDVRTVLEIGATLGAVDYLQAQRYRTRLRSRLVGLLEPFDAMLLPTMPFVAPPIGTRKAPGGESLDITAGLMYFTVLASAAGLPALSLPCGVGDGMPIGMQLIGSPATESALLRIGRSYQQVTDWHRRRPQLEPEAV